jgi:hypothetical protein
MKIACVCGVAAVLAVGGVVQAQVAWSNPSGNATFFTWSNGQNQTGLFGSPTLIAGTTFQFFPTAFVATASNGASHAASDTLSVDLFANAGFQFDAIIINEGGSYALNGASGGSVSANGIAGITEIGGPRSNNSPLIYNPTFPVHSGSGTWTGSTIIDLLTLSGGVPFTQIHLSVTNNLLAVSVGGSTATISKTFLGLPIAITILPSPGAAALLALGGLVSLRRRRA